MLAFVWGFLFGVTLGALYIATSMEQEEEEARDIAHALSLSYTNHLWQCPQARATEQAWAAAVWEHDGAYRARVSKGGK